MNASSHTRTGSGKASLHLPGWTVHPREAHGVQEQLARVRESLFNEWRETLSTQERLLRLALNEAEALAWQSEVPQLLFPALAEEKVRGLARWHIRQRRLSSGRRLAFAA
jgi:hypothetical protein